MTDTNDIYVHDHSLGILSRAVSLEASFVKSLNLAQPMAGFQDPGKENMNVIKLQKMKTKVTDIKYSQDTVHTAVFPSALPVCSFFPIYQEQITKNLIIFLSNQKIGDGTLISSHPICGLFFVKQTLEVPATRIVTKP